MLLAQLARDRGDRAVGQQEARRASEHAWCDGPPFYYKKVYEAAQALLRELA